MTRLVSILRDARFLSAERIRAYAWMLAIFMGVALAYDYLSTALGHHPFAPTPDASGRPAATDFVAFWAAGYAVLSGHIAHAYDPAWLSATEHARTILPANVLLAFFYPPTFLLFCLPFAVLPYLGGFTAFVCLSFATLSAGLRRIVGGGGASLVGTTLPVLAFPGLLMNAATGQTGFWTASCFAWAMIWLERRPCAAGAVLGMLAIKPHLAIAVPVGLGAARRWRALAACGGVAVGWAALSWLSLGQEAWDGFVRSAPAIRDALENHREDWGKLQSLFTTVRLMGLPTDLAYVAQGMLAVFVLAAVALLAWRRPGAGAEMAAITTASLLCTPHVLDYDLAALAVPLAWIAAVAMRGAWQPWEKMLAGVAFLWPLVARLMTQSGAAPIAPFIVLGVFGLVWRRAVDAGAVTEARLAC